ncbi:MAG: leucine-rich repeat protein [Spirochaetaceae bacterium]|jgi:hypothetical protein|nr:leucine-rich repeat protein [Spirochaetaceae bacterium]
MRRNIAVFLFAGLALSAVSAQDVEDFEYRTEIYNGNIGIAITGYNGKHKDIEIPALIRGFPVTVIDDRAFKNKGLIGVEIPETVRKIGKESFTGNKLEGVVVPRNLTEIENDSFDSNLLVNVPELQKKLPRNRRAAAQAAAVQPEQPAKKGALVSGGGGFASKPGADTPAPAASGTSAFGTPATAAPAPGAVAQAKPAAPKQTSRFQAAEKPAPAQPRQNVDLYFDDEDFEEYEDTDEIVVTDMQQEGFDLEPERVRYHKENGQWIAEVERIDEPPRDSMRSESFLPPQTAAPVAAQTPPPPAPQPAPPPAAQTPPPAPQTPPTPPAYNLPPAPAAAVQQTVLVYPSSQAEPQQPVITTVYPMITPQTTIENSPETPLRIIMPPQQPVPQQTAPPPVTPQAAPPQAAPPVPPVHQAAPQPQQTAPKAQQAASKPAQVVQYPAAPARQAPKQTAKSVELGAIPVPYASPGVTQTAGEWLLRFDGGFISAAGYTGYNKILIIPYSVDGHRINGIAPDAFAGKYLQSVSFPSAITAIGERAFRSNAIDGIVIPPSVRTIGAAAFEDNPIRRIKISGGVSIQPDSFPSDFASYYNAGGQRAGTYSLGDAGWTFVAFDKLAYDSM